MNKLKLFLASISILIATTGQVHAGIVFSFTESGGNVLMQSSGVLNTSNLVSVSSSNWGGAGIETNTSPDSDIMGDTTMGAVNTAFRFNTGTDTSIWVGNMFTNENFSWLSSGTTQFTTYYFDNDVRTPGIGLSFDDLVGDLWTPDVSWTTSGTFASIGLTVGEYTITDAVTNEFISIQIGQRQTTGEIPEPGILGLFALGLFALGLMGRGFSRRKA